MIVSHNVIKRSAFLCETIPKPVSGHSEQLVTIIQRLLVSFLENAQNPYSATIIINEIEYGTGFAGSKRAAKMEAGLYQVAMNRLSSTKVIFIL